MKRTISVIFALTFLLCLVGCKDNKGVCGTSDKMYSSFTVIEADESRLILVPYADDITFNSIAYSVPNWFHPSTEIKVGDKIIVCHNGEMTETSPAEFAEIYEMQYHDTDGCIVSVIPD